MIIKMARPTKLIINKDNFYELELFKNNSNEISISIGIHEGGIDSSSKKRNEHIISLDNDQIDALIDTLIELRYE
jgi:hypothetical protein